MIKLKTNETENWKTEKNWTFFYFILFETVKVEDVLNGRYQQLNGFGLRYKESSNGYSAGSLILEGDMAAGDSR